MCPSAIDARVADEMVELLFRDSTQFYFDNVLIVGRDRKQIAGFSPHIKPSDTDAHATVAYLDRGHS